MKGTDYVVQYLRDHEAVTHVFTYAGGTNAWLLDTLQRTPGITFVATRDEKNAALAADGYARVLGRLGVAAPMSGPGATNLLTGIADAYFDSVPVLFLTSQVTTSTYKFDKPVRQLGYQETDIVSIVRPITKRAELPTTAVAMVRELKESTALARAGRPGPVLVDIPSDVQRLEVPEQEVAAPIAVTSDPVIDSGQIETVFALIARAERPVVVVGGGVRTSGTTRELLRFVEHFQLPVVVSLLGKDGFPNDHPRYVGYIGSYGNRYANLTLANCDLVIALGSRLDSRQTAKPSTFARAAKKIHVSIDAHELNTTVKSDVAICGQLKDFFALALAKNTPTPAEKYQPWFTYIADVKREFGTEAVAPYAGVNPKLVLHALSAASRGNEIFVTDVGNNQMWSAQELTIRAGQRFLTSGGLGTMGFAIPVGIGAHFAAPERGVITILGDGGFQMSIPELQTIAHYRVPLKMVVFNNQILGLMWHFQNENFKSGHPATEDGYSCPDLQKLAAAYGIPAQRLEKDQAIDQAIAWLNATPGPALLEVTVDRVWPGYPKVKPGNPLEGQLPEVDPERLRRFMLVPPVV